LQQRFPPQNFAVIRPEVFEFLHMARRTDTNTDRQAEDILHEISC